MLEFGAGLAPPGGQSGGSAAVRVGRRSVLLWAFLLLRFKGLTGKKVT